MSAGRICAVPSCSQPLRTAGTSPIPEGLCAACASRLRNNISSLRVLYRDCGSLLVRPRYGFLERTSTFRGGGISLNEAAVEVRGEILAVAASWAALVVDERRLAARPRREVPPLTEFLLAHVDWLSRHPAAADAYAEIARVVSKAETCATSSRNHIDLGPCSAADCEGIVRVTFHSRTTDVSCEHGHRPMPDEWLELAQRTKLAPAAGAQ